MNRVAELDRYRGCLVGLSAGDALGTTLEFSPPDSFKPIGQRQLFWPLPVASFKSVTKILRLLTVVNHVRGNQCCRLSQR